MASDTDIMWVRLQVSEPNDDNGYTDQTLDERLDGADSRERLVFEIWSEKAGAAAELVDISEGGSSRKMGDVHEQALAMARWWGDQIPGGEPTGGRTRVMKLRR